MVDTHRWSAKAFSKKDGRPIEGSVCATVWPTQSLNSAERWFDELYLWTEGFHASTTQRARIQSAALHAALQMLDRDAVTKIGVTLSFGTVERIADHLAVVLQAYALVTHRFSVLLRGSLARLQARSVVRAFREHLREQQVPVGYMLTFPSISMELEALGFVRPDFAKLVAPNSTRVELWRDVLAESREAGVPPDRLIVSALETPEQVSIAAQVGIAFGQGNAVRPAFAPPAFTSIGTLQ